MTEDRPPFDSSSGNRARPRGLAGLRGAYGFLTPLFGAAAPSPEALWWFPAVGASIGLAVGGVWWAAGRAWSPLVAAAIAVVADLALTGMLHADGLCDAADGLLPHLDTERRLRVMSEPGVGAFGVTVMVATLGLRWFALAALEPSPVLLAALWGASRTSMCATMVAVPYARAAPPGPRGASGGGGGLATAFMGSQRGRQFVPLITGGLGAALALALAWSPGAGPLAVMAGTVAAAAVVLLGLRRLDGFTGDVLGAAGVVGETVGLVVASARW